MSHMAGRRLKPILIVHAILVVILCSSSRADDFPLRKKYSQLEPITTRELAKARATDEAVVIDVRTKGEFEVIHLKGAINIPHIMTDKQHEALKAATQRPYKYLVFYCNGVLCSKSYKAAQMATLQGFEGVRNYDAGVLEWAEKYPQDTEFFGEPMSSGNSRGHLIPESDFKKCLVDTLTFIGIAKSGEYEVYDIRDSSEKAEYPIDLPRKKEATIDQLHQLLKEGKFPMSSVVLLDNVGKQVIWAQYYLERFGVKNYFFLAGGVAQWRADGRDSKGDELGKVFGRAHKK